ncbi:lipase family protein [Rathayibacter sp. YIM 133350]|uniref:alpha/beta fold hydrolase n=1 Tax=Rathayibacter sp. YIM 133350 TaxID=3131992 RepID=UPI00307E1BB5
MVLALAGCSFEGRLVEGFEQKRTDAPFYASPTAPAEQAAPGSIVRADVIDNPPSGSRGWRVVYHSTDLGGDDIQVSGVIVAPTAPAPSGGRTVISWAHPTTGTAPRCGPSVGVDPFDDIEGLTDLLKRGYVVAATDYSGMGLPGPPSYLIGETEGRNVLDAARAARKLGATHSSSRVALWGHSQGGQAALFAAQLATSYAPELAVQAVGVAAPAVDLAALLTADIVDVSGVSIGAYAFAAYSEVYGPTTPGADLDEILTPAAAAAVPKMNALCLLGQNAQLHAIADPLVGAFLTADPATTEPWASLLAENTPGAERISIPLYVAQGDTDTLVRPGLTDAFVGRQSGLGADVTYEKIADTGHGLVALRALGTFLPWLEAHAPAVVP